MAFNSSGVYTPPTGATTAIPGDLIKSTTWNSIFTDLSSALTLLGEQLYSTTAVTATPYVPIATDTFLLVNFAGAVVINLPTSASRNGYPLTVKDISGAANTNNITINGNGTEKIEGLSPVTINTAWGGFRLYPVTGGWVIRP